MPRRGRSSRRLDPIHPARAVRGLAAVLGLAVLVSLAPAASAQCGSGPYTQWFRQSDCTFADQGRNNPFFPLVPGSWVELRGSEDGHQVKVRITVTSQTKMVQGIRTRVVEEREWEDGELVEVSRNWFAICRQNGSVFYFGESVDNYEDGQIDNHDGSWQAGVDGARAGVIMPGLFLLGSRYQQEVAPDVAMDRGCNSRMGLTVPTRVRTFTNCVEVLDSSPFEPDVVDVKQYCPGAGLVRDENLRLWNWSGQP